MQPLISVIIPTFNRREKLIRLIKSVLKSNYKNIEIIIIDDASTDNTYQIIKEVYPQVEITKNKKELLISGSRNVGILQSRGDFIFLIDDDNVVDEYTIEELLRVMIDYKNIGVASPLMYYYLDPTKIWCAGIKRNMITSKTRYVGNGDIDMGQFDQIIESNDFPNAFMTRKDIVKDLHILFDEKNFPIHYEESDFCERIKMTGMKIALVPAAKIWHDVYPNRIGFKGLDNNLRSYYTSRNRVLFHRKYSKLWQYFLFVTLFLPIFTSAYIFIIIREGVRNHNLSAGINACMFYIKGVFSGLFHM